MTPRQAKGVVVAVVVGAAMVIALVASHLLAWLTTD